MSSHPLRVLLVDDSPAVCEALRWALEDSGDFVVIGVAHDGISAIRYASVLLPDIVILDIALPLLDGYAVARGLKDLSSPPVIVFLSVHTCRYCRQLATEAGGDAFAEKSLGWSLLIARIRQTIPPRTL